MSDPVTTKGRTRDIIENLYEWIDRALARNYDTYFITTNREFNIVEITKFPIVVIDVMTPTFFDATFGRRMPSIGLMAYYNFILYIYTKIDSTVDSRDLSCMTVTRRIIDYLEKMHVNSTEMSQHGIWFFSITDTRPSPTGINNISRYIVNGTLSVVREDEP